eukprot:550552-Pelagomonas_calceolata.AAC.1
MCTGRSWNMPSPQKNAHTRMANGQEAHGSASKHHMVVSHNGAKHHTYAGAILMKGRKGQEKERSRKGVGCTATYSMD